MIISIDPGMNGCITISTTNPYQPLSFHYTPTKKVKQGKRTKVVVDYTKFNTMLHFLVQEFRPEIAVIEKQQAISSKDGVARGITSTSNTMKNYGWLIGWFNGKGIPVESPSPKTWQRIYPDDIEGTPKVKSIAYCSLLFPTLDLRKNGRCSKAHDGKTDSILIGKWYVNESSIKPG